MADDATKSTRMGLVLAASSAGTVFEWYDFFIFGSLAGIIAKHFFASVGETQGYIFALLTFAAGFAVRPLGALVFGWFGDRTGRKRTFLVTITIMGLATFAIGLLPDASAAGLDAAWALLALRLLQGFAVGGEYGGAAIYVAEHADPARRGLATGWIQVAATAGLFLALAVIFVTRAQVGEAAFGAWGWRIPFLLSAGLLVISLWIRLRLDESPLFRQMQEEGRGSCAPLSEAFFRWRNLRLVLIALFALMMGQGVVWYTANFYAQIFLERVVKVEPSTVNLMIMAALVGSALLHMFFSWLSDLVGRKPIMLFGLALAALVFIPGFRMLTAAVNPQLAQASSRTPVTVAAEPKDCSLQFDPIGKSKFTSSCDIAKSTLTSLGVPYRNQAATGTARILVGTHEVASFDGAKLTAAEFAAARKRFETVLKQALASAGYPLSASPAQIDFGKALLILIALMTGAAALYGPQAAALVELFPTRIRYSALSLPYHIGNGWFGGFLPAISFAVVAATGNIYAGLWYPVVIAGIGFFVTLFFLPETRGQDIAN
ncbi:MAG: MFS transporter [Alphaproteobacteria bacterium]|nr:MFS transporter [Alphaproteobacteria bacterium]MBV9692378.1 MFS transporter [Alphaproteobacteria bacterium]